MTLRRSCQLTHTNSETMHKRINRVEKDPTAQQDYHQGHRNLGMEQRKTGNPTVEQRTAYDDRLF